MIEVIQAGPVVTVQDLGREGYRHHGVSRAGALDGLALTIANRLVGNPDNTAGLEMMFGATTLLFEKDVCFALTGSDCFAVLDGTPVYPGWRCHAQAGQILRLSAPKQGLCAYLAVRGGISVPPVMGSAATDLQAGFGGVDGRPLRKGDRLLLEENRQPAQVDLSEKVGVLLPTAEAVIRVCAGPEAGMYSVHARKQFFSSAWKISVSSNRMGFRLEGSPIAETLDGNLLSHAVFPGVIQIPPDGQPIILAAEGQTSGGYPRMAVVIDSDLWRLGQLRPGEMIYFQEVSLQEAAVAADKQAHYLQRIAFALASH
ncbi:5-oxoprolinase subunit C family protein [Vibrio mangrovi]|uniref:Biotin-dependent carboxyltransferase family protein n=1 Tax=Vibrio mangrovi TaxID=474394 RepID=A0A1Y6IMD8_9VIBR|nr:biotin-dependent carboxyltransferase family protein [Vibrio mangrovi]MDW6004393.1 biotin-dependent carboxyltransferase family protein [Vibrio mangrovi]SMR98808.1 KipI antagonist [Vibrio mangrovi]